MHQPIRNVSLPYLRLETKYTDANKACLMVLKILLALNDHIDDVILTSVFSGSGRLQLAIL